MNQSFQDNENEIYFSDSSTEVYSGSGDQDRYEIEPTVYGSDDELARLLADNEHFHQRSTCTSTHVSLIE